MRSQLSEKLVDKVKTSGRISESKLWFNPIPTPCLVGTELTKEISIESRVLILAVKTILVVIFASP